MTLTLHTINASLGFYRVKLEGRTVAAFVLPSYAVALGWAPTDADILSSVRELHPSLQIPDTVTIKRVNV